VQRHQDRTREICRQTGRHLAQGLDSAGGRPDCHHSARVTVRPGGAFHAPRIPTEEEANLPEPPLPLRRDEFEVRSVAVRRSNSSFLALRPHVSVWHPPVMSQRPPAVGEPTSIFGKVGTFRFLHSECRWEWSDAVAQMHGYAPGEVVPTTDLVMSHKHPDDAARVAFLIERMRGHGEPFSSRHRIVDVQGRTHVVLVLGGRSVDADGITVGTEGLYVDVTDLDSETSVEAAVAEFAAYRSAIEQAKGMLMVVYGISAARAFDILAWRSQTSNTKLRALADQLVADFGRELHIDADIRERADHLLLTAHTRLSPGQADRDGCPGGC
jgi:hypothetical protein